MRRSSDAAAKEWWDDDGREDLSPLVPPAIGSCGVCAPKPGRAGLLPATSRAARSAASPLGVASVDEVLALGRQEAKNDCNERKQPL